MMYSHPLDLPDWLVFVLAALNLAACCAIAWACICRLSLMSEDTTRPRFRHGYVLLLVAAVSSGGSPWWWGEWPGPGQLGVALALVYFLGVGYGAWRKGIPWYAQLGGRDIGLGGL